MTERWTNWSSSVACRPRRVLAPESEAEVVRAVRDAAVEGLVVRAAGAGHSFSPLVETDGAVLSLSALRGLRACDPGRLEATAGAGTVLRELSEALLEHGVALENLGDIDVQHLAGALATGTHGTGRTLGNLSSRVTGLRMVLADGSVLRLGADDGRLDAARVSLGALGLVTEVTLRVRPAYRLHERVRRMPIEECLEQVEAGVAEHRHFEFFYYPGRERAEVKTLVETTAEPDDLPGVRSERIGWSGRVLPSVRDERFFEMEYSVPAEAGLDCFAEVRERIRSKHPEVTWPVEYRTVAADGAWLSMAHGRDTVSVSVHQDGRLPFRDFFADVEPVFRSHAGRPHWGKVHGLGASELRALYPRFDDFAALRTELDPEGRFLSDPLRRLLVGP